MKDAEQIEKLIGYFSRNLSFIPCYALRQKLGLRVSSNPVEKANDLLVSNRQKHNGMSWSADGSSSLAILTSLRRNDEHMQWLRHHDIRFQFALALKSLLPESGSWGSQFHRWKFFHGWCDQKPFLQIVIMNLI